MWKNLLIYLILLKIIYIINTKISNESMNIKTYLDLYYRIIVVSNMWVYIILF